ncbi:MAG: TetR/AcrR family transcriptional regulator [bacterium]|nr:TetR/AcrR family transcriptional regulator [bacterium]
MGTHERKEREREQRRQDILTSARAAFVKCGLEQTSMDRIAQEAELAKGTLYLYFKNREELIIALMSEDLEALLQMLQKVSKRKQSADKKLLEAVKTFYRFSSNNEFFYRVITQVNLHTSFSVAAAGDNAIRFCEQNERVMSHLKDLVQEGADTGLFHLDHPPQYTVMLLMFSMKGSLIIHRNGMAPPNWTTIDAEQMLTDIAKIFIAGLKGDHK